ncbi:MAG: metalloregulator ArsR/SmtB family transcription factor [Acidimicrobiia bacterium]|nr:metalloregulator ArsR/SmtB family transcription factor [Acidimicrobiia bacterium]
MDTFTALADPTRRSIIEMLAAEDRNAGDIAGAFTVSRPAISRHLRVLREAGLVSAREHGQQRIYTLEPSPLAEVAGWVNRYSAFWEERLDRLSVAVSARAREGNEQ